MAGTGGADANHDDMKVNSLLTHTKRLWRILCDRNLKKGTKGLDNDDEPKHAWLRTDKSGFFRCSGTEYSKHIVLRMT